MEIEEDISSISEVNTVIFDIDFVLITIPLK